MQCGGGDQWGNFLRGSSWVLPINAPTSFYGCEGFLRQDHQVRALPHLLILTLWAVIWERVQKEGSTSQTFAWQRASSLPAMAWGARDLPLYKIRILYYYSGLGILVIKARLCLEIERDGRAFYQLGVVRNLRGHGSHNPRSGRKMSPTIKMRAGQLSLAHLL